MRKTLMVVFTLVTLAAVGGAQPARPSGGARDTAASDSLFRSARALLDDRQYRRAARAFASLAELYPTTARAGDALYWQAWGLYQLGKDNGSKTDLGQALDVLSRVQLELRQERADGQRRHGAIRPDPCAAGQARRRERGIRHHQASGNAAPNGGVHRIARRRRDAHGGARRADEHELPGRHSDPRGGAQAARPVQGRAAQTRRVHDRAEARVVRRTHAARRRTHRPEHRRARRRDLLAGILASGSRHSRARFDHFPIEGRRGSKEGDLRAVAAAARRRAATLQRVAQDEKIPEDVRGDAIFWLGQNGIADLEFFKTLFKSTKNTELRSKILNGVATGRSPGASAWLLDIARDKTFDIETRAMSSSQADAPGDRPVATPFRILLRSSVSFVDLKSVLKNSRSAIPFCPSQKIASPRTSAGDLLRLARRAGAFAARRRAAAATARRSPSFEPRRPSIGR